LEGYYIALTKPGRKTIPTSFCNNVVNHETKEFIKKIIPCSLYHARHIDSIKWGYYKIIALI
jgi:hypothetical protein